MTWAIVALLAAGVWIQRLLGMFAGAKVLERRPGLALLATLIPAAVVMAVIVQLTFGVAGSLQLDARGLGMAVAGVLVWRRAPFVVVVLSAATVTALARLL